MKKIYLIFRDFARQLTRDNINAFASSTAFFFFLSLMPTLIILCSFLPFTPLTEGDLITAVTSVAPEVLEPIVVSLIKQMYDQSVGTLPIAVLVMIWSCGKGMLALMRGLNVVNGVSEDRNYLFLRLEASFYMVITVISLLVSLGLSVFGEVVMHTVIRMFPHIGELFSFLMHFRFVFVWVLLTIIFTFFFRNVSSSILSVALYFYILVPLLCIGIELLICRFREQPLHIVWSAIVLAPCAVVAIILITILSRKRLREAVRRRLHF